MAEQIVNILAEIGKGACFTVVILVAFIIYIQSRSNKE